MFHEISSQMASVPEELYNLTQLADVTLAAGKLSTTNVQKIKNFIKHEPTADDPSRPINLTELIVLKHCNSASDLSESSADTPRRTLNDSGYITDMEYSEKKSFLYALHSGPNMSIESENSMKNSCKRQIKSFVEQQQSSFSSSEDDSTYNYSHKIFDKRKARKICYDNPEHTYNDEKTFERSPTVETEDSMLSISETESNAEFSSSTKSTDGTSNADDVHTCPECNKKYSTSSNLARHRQTHRSLFDKKARRCPHCDKVYVSMPAYSMHVRTHNQGCECPHCGKRFSRPWLLQGHIRTHTGEKPFQCSICMKAFADKSNLRAHIQTHSNTKPHTCARCGKAFALKSYLYKHEESSCMRNHTKADKEKCNSKSNTRTRMKSSKRTAVTGAATATNNNSHASVLKKIKAEPVNGLSTKSVNPISKECIFIDGKKSLMVLPESCVDPEPYPRISVIRTVASQSSPPPKNEQPSCYQEKPVDFSPKHKYNLNGRKIETSSITDIPRQYTMMVV